MINPLDDPWWRLNNLYYIVDKKGEKIRFKPNFAQKELYENMWYLNIILKARQLGLTTFIQIFMLDRTLFNDNTSAGIIAHTKNDAISFFKNKIKFAYDNLPEEIRQAIPADTDKANELRFANGSMITVGTSLRSGTMNYLHISEFGKMAAKTPEKADEVVSGALNTVEPGQFIFIESTAEGPFGHFYEMVKTSRNVEAMVEAGEMEMTPMDYKFFFFPWYKHPSYVLDARVVMEQEDKEYFAKIKKEHGIVLTDDRKSWYVKKKLEQKALMTQEYPSTPDEAFERSTDTMIFGDALLRARRNNQMTDIPIKRGVLTHTFWDLGRNDLNTIWFMQDGGDWYDFILYYQDRLKDLTHYAEVLKEVKEEYGLTYGYHHLPHDVNVTDLSSKNNMSRQDILEAAGVKPIRRVPKSDNLLADIEASRKMIAECRFDKVRCEEGIEALSGYSWAYDKVAKMPLQIVARNKYRNGADSFRQFVQGYRRGGGYKAQHDKMTNNSGRKYLKGRGQDGGPSRNYDHIV